MRHSPKKIPLILTDNGKILNVLAANEKAVAKTTETKLLWILHPTTNKIVCSTPEIAIQSVLNGESWVEVRVKTDLNLARPELKRVNKKPEHSKSFDYAFLDTLRKILLKRKRELPEGSYSSYLFTKGTEKIRKKIGEEAVEVLLAKSADELCNESADLLYHLWVYFVQKNINPKKILRILSQRHIEGSAHHA